MRIFIVIGIVLVLVGGLAAFAYFRNQPEGEVSATESPAAQVYTLAVLTDEVLLKLPDQSQFTNVKETVQIGIGSEIKTSKTGRAKLLYPNGTVTAIDGDSYLKIEALDGNGEHSRIELVFGSMWSKIKNILGTGDYYEVGTDNIVASVRGTIFALEYRNQIATVYGLGNSVKVSSRNPQTKQAISNTSVIVDSGQKVVVSGTPSASVSATPRVQSISDSDLSREIISRYILELDDEDLDDNNNRGIRSLLERLRRRLTPTSSPTKTPKPTATPRPSPTPTPTPTPDTRIKLESVIPGTIKAGEKFTINGTNFIIGNTKKVSTVRVGSMNTTFTVIDAQTIFVTTPALNTGTYDVKVISTSNTTSTLSDALKIQ